MADSTATETVWLLRAGIRRYSSEIRHALSEGGYGDIPTRGLWVIGGLARQGGPVAPKSLVEELGVTKQAVSQLVDLLVSLGYLRRDGDPTDGRRQVVALTGRGQQAADVIQHACSLVDSDAAQRLGNDSGLLAKLLYDFVAVEE